MLRMSKNFIKPLSTHAVKKNVTAKLSTLVNKGSFKHTARPLCSAGLSMQRLTESKPLAKTDDTVELPMSTLNSGYQSLHQRLNNLITQAASIAVISPALSGIWLLATEQMLLDSPVAIASLATGGMLVAGRMLQMKRVKDYARLSAITNPIGPSVSDELNTRVKQIIAGDNPKVRFNTNGLKIAGPVGNIENPSTAVQNALSRIDSMNRVVLPNCILTDETDKLVDFAHERWLARINMPLAILNIMAIASKDPKDRKIDDYVVLASSSYSLYDYFSGPTVGEARQQFTDSLANCKTPQDVLKVLIDNKILDEGGMSFLNEWIKKQESIAIRIGRTGVPILYKNRETSFCGPYPIQLFPPKRIREDLSKSEPTISQSNQPTNR